MVFSWTLSEHVKGEYFALMELRPITSPKQTGKPQGRDAWYPYYAGFSSQFAKSALERYPPVAGKAVLDPWNGSGTTTQVCAEMGFRSIGCDINPATIVIAKARRLQSCVDVKESIAPLAERLVEAARRPNRNDASQSDPLAAWLIPSSVNSIRAIEQAIRDHFIPKTSSASIVDTVATARFSDLTAYFYLILFRAVRQILLPFRTANPTWIRVPPLTQRLRPSREIVAEAFKVAVQATLPSIDDQTMSSGGVDTLAKLLLADSRRLPLEDGSVGGILSSPPYLTRLDYAISLAPELAVLAQDNSQIKALREKMLGTTMVVADYKIVDLDDGYTMSCLKKIESHDSKASLSYYFKNISGYLKGLQSSVAEASRVLAAGAPLALVVQNSFYKDVHLDLARIVTEFGESTGLELIEMHHFPVERHLGLVHRNHRQHCKVSGRVETVVAMRKKSERCHDVN